jgi:hypothetical protein
LLQQLRLSRRACKPKIITKYKTEKWLNNFTSHSHAPPTQAERGKSAAAAQLKYSISSAVCSNQSLSGMSNDYSPLPSHEGFELRRRSVVSEGVGEGFSLYSVNHDNKRWSLPAITRRLWSALRTKFGAALLVALLLVGAFVARSWDRTALDIEENNKAISHVRAAAPALFAAAVFAEGFADYFQRRTG